LAEPTLDVKVSLRLVRRLWPWVAATCLVGAAAGAAYQLVLIPRYHASSLVLLPTATGTAAGTTTTGHATITTDARIADSAAVVGPAGRRIGSTLSLKQLQARVTAAPTASGVLRITASGPSAVGATRLANAVAAELVAFVTTSGSAANSNAVVGLESEVKQVDSQINDVQAQLVTADQQLAADGPASASGQAESQLVSKLTSEQSSLTLQLDSLKSQISEAQLEQLATNQGTEVIQRATSATGLSPAEFTLPVLLGVVGGLLVGYAGVVVLSRRDGRLRSRDAIAEAVGAPVLLSMEERPPRSQKEWSELFERHVPTPSMQWHVRRGLREVGRGAAGSPEPRVLRVLAFGDDDGAAAAAVELALASAAAGTETVFAMAGTTGDQVALRSVCARFDAEDRRPRPMLAVRSDLRLPVGTRDGLAIELHTLDRADPKVDGAPSQRRDAVVLVVSAGRATAEDLARAAIAADAAGLRIGGIAVVNPASEDHTIGRFPDGAVRRTMVQYGRSAETGGHAVPRPVT
jgi:capsular polysaccharide biosynthesis protein